MEAITNAMAKKKLSMLFLVARSWQAGDVIISLTSRASALVSLDVELLGAGVVVGGGVVVVGGGVVFADSAPGEFGSKMAIGPSTRFDAKISETTYVVPPLFQVGATEFSTT